MCGTSASSEPSITTVRDVALLGDVDDRVAEGLPVHRRLFALEQQHAALEAGDVGLVEDVARPLDEAHVAVDHADLRAVRLEVEEVLGVDLGDLACARRSDRDS